MKEYKDIPGYEGLYKINEEAAIFSVPRKQKAGGFIKLHQHRKGYGSRNTIKVKVALQDIGYSLMLDVVKTQYEASLKKEFMADFDENPKNRIVMLPIHNTTGLPTAIKRTLALLINKTK